MASIAVTFTVAEALTREDDAMHLQLRDIEDLFCHRGDVHVIFTLQDCEPLRFSELAQRIYERSPIRIADNTITRALQRLEVDGVVICENSDPRHPTYQLTDLGRQRAEVIDVLGSAMASYQQANAIKTF